jgi:DNA-binding transcriptional LysR family regulator
MSVTIDVALLATFVEVADAASFSGAARALGTTTATVSRSIAKLEESVGSRLFHRTTRRVTLTTAGKALYEPTAAHERALAHATKELPEHHSEPAGTLKLTAPYDLGATFLGSVSARFVALYPKVQVQAEFSSRVVDLAAEGAMSRSAMLCGSRLSGTRCATSPTAAALTSSWTWVGGHAFTDSLRCLATQGRLMVLGFSAGQGLPEVKVNRLLLNNVDVRGVGWRAYACYAPGTCTSSGRPSSR